MNSVVLNYFRARKDFGALDGDHCTFSQKENELKG